MTDNCPNCKISLQGEPIPEKHRSYYAPDSTHYSRKVALYDRARDRTTHYRCPDCSHVWKA